jgi:hypothetical protein
MLDHHPLGLGRPLAVVRPLPRHLIQQASSHLAGVEGDVDVAVDRLDRGKAVVWRRQDRGGDPLGDLQRLGPDRLVHQALGLLLGEIGEGAAGLQILLDRVAGDHPGRHRGHAPGAFERDRAQLQRPGSQIEPQAAQGGPHGVGGAPFFARQDATWVRRAAVRPGCIASDDHWRHLLSLGLLGHCLFPNG